MSTEAFEIGKGMVVNINGIEATLEVDPTTGNIRAVPVPKTKEQSKGNQYSRGETIAIDNEDRSQDSGRCKGGTIQTHTTEPSVFVAHDKIHPLDSNLHDNICPTSYVSDSSHQNVCHDTAAYCNVTASNDAVHLKDAPSRQCPSRDGQGGLDWNLATNNTNNAFSSSNVCSRSAQSNFEVGIDQDFFELLFSCVDKQLQEGMLSENQTQSTISSQYNTAIDRDSSNYDSERQVSEIGVHDDVSSHQQNERKQITASSCSHPESGLKEMPASPTDASKNSPPKLKRLAPKPIQNKAGQKLYMMYTFPGSGQTPSMQLGQNLAPLLSNVLIFIVGNTQNNSPVCIVPQNHVRPIILPHQMSKAASTGVSPSVHATGNIGMNNCTTRYANVRGNSPVFTDSENRVSRSGNAMPLPNIIDNCHSGGSPSSQYKTDASCAHRTQHCTRPKRRNQEGDRFQCNICERVFRRMDSLVKHRRTHFITCRLCCRTFRQEKDFHAHLKDHQIGLIPDKNGDVVYKCELCGQQYLHSGNILKHKLSKHGDMFKGQQQQVSQVQKKNMRRRLGQEESNIKKTDVTSSEQGALNHASRGAKNGVLQVQLPEMNQVIVLPTGFETIDGVGSEHHFKQTAEVEKEGKGLKTTVFVAPSGRRPCHSVVCDKCGKLLKRNSLYLHASRHCDALNPDKHTSSILCQECNRLFLNMMSFKKHLHLSCKGRSKRQSESYRVSTTTCKGCGKSVSNTSLSVHRSMYCETATPQSVVCSNCGKRFRHRHSLRNHTKWHCQENPQKKCPVKCICAKTFKNYKAFQAHYLRHCKKGRDLMRKSFS